MPLHGLQLVAGLIGHGAGGLLAGASAVPSPSVLLEELGAVYVDAGSRGEPSGLDAYLVKLAVLVRRHSGGGVSERVLHPVMRTKEGVLPPILLGRGSERVRQAAVYVVELASLLAISRRPGLVFGEDEPERLLLVRHGPLLQMISQYLSRPYVVEVEEARKLLYYAGLERGEAYELIDGSHPCGPSGASSGSVVLGLLALQILARLVREARRGRRGVAGMVEDVSRSRSLVAASLAGLLGSVSPDSGASTLSKAARKLRDKCMDYYEAGAQRVESCLCPSLAVDQLLDSRTEWEELLASTNRVLQERFGYGLGNAPRDYLEAAILWSGALPDITDSELLYTLYYMGATDYPATRPLSHTPRLRIIEYYASSNPLVKCTAGEIEALLGELSVLRYQYFSPVKPPSCTDLESAIASKGLGLRPCELAALYAVPPAIRLEYVDGMPLVEHARALTVYPARIVLYGYPPQLLVVDQYSRVSLEEALAFHHLAEALVERLQPYTGFIRTWETRVAATV